MSASFPGFSEVCADVRTQSQLEIVQSYQNIENIPQLRAFHVGHHPDNVLLLANRISSLVFGSAVPHPAVGLVVPGHDRFAPERKAVHDGTQPPLFEDCYIQQFNGNAERQTQQWFRQLFGPRIPRSLLEVVDGGFIGTTCTLEDDEIRQPYITKVSDPEVAFVISKSDVLNPVMCGRDQQVNASLQIFLERYPNFVAALCSPNFTLSTEQYGFLLHELSELPKKGVSFYESQKRQLVEDGQVVFTGQSVVKSLLVYLEPGFSRLHEAYDIRTWEWLKDPQSLVARLRRAISFYKPETDK